MKCQILFSGKNKRNITNLSSVELIQRMAKVNLNCYSASHNYSRRHFEIIFVILYQENKTSSGWQMILT